MSLFLVKTTMFHLFISQRKLSSRQKL